MQQIFTFVFKWFSIYSSVRAAKCSTVGDRILSEGDGDAFHGRNERRLGSRRDGRPRQSSPPVAVDFTGIKIRKGRSRDSAGAGVGYSCIILIYGTGNKQRTHFRQNFSNIEE